MEYLLIHKVQAILDRLEPKNIHDIRSFHRLTTFYRGFIKGFSIIMSPVIYYMKQGEFKWTGVATKAFGEIKKKMTEALVIGLPDFTKVFEVECDTSSVGIGGVLIQEHHPIAYLSEKLNEAIKSIQPMTKSFMWQCKPYATGTIIYYCRSFSSTWTMKPYTTSIQLNYRHGCWVEFLQA